MTEDDEHPSGRRSGRLAKAAIALLCAVVLAFGLAGPLFAQPAAGTAAQAADDDDRLDLSRYSKWSRPLAGVVVGLDPGHNGGNVASPDVISQRVSDGRGEFAACDTIGTRSHSGYPEHEFTFDVAQMLTEHLEYLGATVLSTRADDETAGPCVDLRGRFAEDNDVDLLVSLHANSRRAATVLPTDDPREPLGPGFYVTVSDPALSPSQTAPSQDLAQAVVEGLLEAGLEPNAEIDQAIAGRDDVPTLNFARRPAVQVHLGQLRDWDEAEVMASETGQRAYAEALAQGIVRWHTDDSR